MFERARREASDQATPQETLIQLSAFAGMVLCALKRCAQQKLEQGIPTQDITIEKTTYNEARYCRSFVLNAHLWGELLPDALIEKNVLMGSPWAEEPLLALFSLETPTQSLGRYADSISEVLYLLAQNPSTPSALLKKLFGVSQTRVRDAVAENPNAPIVDLFSQNFNTGLQPESVLKNPAFPLLLVERPDFFRIIPQWLAGDFLRAPSCTVELLQALIDHPDSNVHVMIAEHHLVTPEQLEQLSKSNDSRVRSGVAKHVHTPPPILSKLAHDYDYSVQRSVAKNHQTPDDGVEVLARSSDNVVKELLVQNPKTTSKALHILAQEKSLALLRGVIDHPNVTPKTLHLLAQDRRKALHLLLAKHPRLPLETVQLFALSPHWQVKRALLKNPATPPEIILQLSAEIAKVK